MPGKRAPREGRTGVGRTFVSRTLAGALDGDDRASRQGQARARGSNLAQWRGGIVGLIEDANRTGDRARAIDFKGHRASIGSAVDQQHANGPRSIAGSQDGPHTTAQPSVGIAVDDQSIRVGH